MKIKIIFKKLIQDSQQLGSNDQHMVSRVFFDIESEKVKLNSYADVKQSVGSDFESTQLEVSRPHNYEGPFDYFKFQQLVETYYRNLIGSTGTGINISGGGNIRMSDNIFVQTAVYEIEVN
jgi:hypothetical protein|tara:strand:- start:5502 stop:5864 length:363 start_codon:yes stop_codon:yes gene_type:complete